MTRRLRSSGLTQLRRRLASLFFAGLTLAAGEAAATATAYSERCDLEVLMHCGDITPGAGRQTACVMSKQRQFSTLCRLEIQVFIEQRWQMASYCRESSEKLCPKIKPGKGRLYACLKFNEELLPASCKAQLE